MAEFFHAAFEAVLAGDDRALDPWLAEGVAAHAGLAVYRNTVAKGRVDALAGLYPSIVRLVGADWFRDAALIFAAARRPSHPVLDDYGDDFPDWLERFPPAAGLAYLAPVARLDAAWSRAHRAADAPVLASAALAGLSTPALFAARAVLHPSVSLFWFDWTVVSIWQANRPGAEAVADLAWEARAEGLLLLRPGLTVTSRRLTRLEWVFLDACRRGLTLGEAASAALAHDLSSDLGTLFAGLLTAGAFTRIAPETPS